MQISKIQEIDFEMQPFLFTDPTTGSMSDSITKHYEGGQGLQDPYMTNDDVNDENKDYKQKPGMILKTSKVSLTIENGLNKFTYAR